MNSEIKSMPKFYMDTNNEISLEMKEMYELILELKIIFNTKDVTKEKYKISNIINNIEKITYNRTRYKIKEMK